MFQVIACNKPMNTPDRTPLCVPTQALAEAIKVEWEALKGVPKRAQIPMTQFANTAIDHTAKNPQALLESIVKHGNYDVLCYREHDNPALALRQNQYWQPWCEWMLATHGAAFTVFTGLMPQPQNPAALARLREIVAAQNPFWLLATAQAAGLLGSAILALAFVAQKITVDEAIALSLLDEYFQSEQWGEPEELKEKRDGLRCELVDLARYVALLDE